MSAAPAKSQDPSMEEILASIRRIIADDQDGAKTPDAAMVAAAGGQQVAPDEDEDVLDLAEEPEPKARALPDLEVEVPDLAFQEHEPEPQPAPLPEPAAPEVEARAPEPVAPAPPPLPPPAPAAERRLEALISTETTASVGHAFNLLSHTIMSQNAHTLEDLVKEMLRPMLKTWLDDNLPPLVERLVRSEIERVARGGR